jgi:hypothetical protein
VLAAAGAAVLAFTLLRLRAGRPGGRMSTGDVADGRQLLVARGRRITGDLTALTDVIAEREDEDATRQHQRAMDVVAEVRSRLGRTSGQRVQARAHRELDEAEWLLGGLRARLDGFVEPLQPPRGMPATCFFDGEHGLATVEVDLGGIALQRIPVRSCAACAVGLVRGEFPCIGRVEIGGRSLPWAAAPRWCGSYGWAPKDLKHLHYDGELLFVAAERSRGRRRQTVAERARGMRGRVLPIAPEVLPEELPDALADDLDAYAPAGAGPELQHEAASGEAAVRNAFAAMETDVPAGIEAAPVAGRERPQE